MTQEAYLFFGRRGKESSFPKKERTLGGGRKDTNWEGKTGKERKMGERKKKERWIKDGLKKIRTQGRKLIRKGRDKKRKGGKTESRDRNSKEMEGRMIKEEQDPRKKVY